MLTHRILTVGEDLNLDRPKSRNAITRSRLGRGAPGRPPTPTPDKPLGVALLSYQA